jgi:probable HAF family extracellular repeat protein
MYRRLLLLTVAAVALLVPVTAVAGPGKATHFPYRLIDLGTLGGPQAGQGNGPYLSESGLVAGTADTAVPDLFGPNQSGAFNGDPFVQHTLIWRNGAVSDLGALGPQSATNSSYPNGINARGDEAGISNNGTIDPLTRTAETEAVLWKDGQIINLGTFGGNEGQAFALNNHDQVVGFAANTTPDPFSMEGWGVQARAFLWQNGRLHDLGTLGGADSNADFVNDRGQVAGVSYTNSVPNPITGQPQADAYLWQNGVMRDLGSLGGSIPTFGGITALNNHGEVVGQSDLPGDLTAHPFLWDGTKMIDLGTLGGDNGTASDVNQNGAVDGIADLADGTHRGFLWTKGTMHDLPPLAGHLCSNANGMNNHDQVVGNATNCFGGDLSAVIWNEGVPTDLNTLIAPSPLHLTESVNINNRGEIIGYGVLPNGNVHNFLLIPHH